MLKTVGVDKNISIEDTVRFVLETKDSKGCPSTPYRVDSVKVYFVSREFTDSTASQYDLVSDEEASLKSYEEARNALCARRKESVSVATTADISLSGLQMVDGILVSEGDRVLVKDQSDASENGIYVAAEGAWRRAGDAREMARGSYVFVEEGIENIGGGWYLETGGPIKVGSTPLAFVKFSVNGEPSSPDGYSEARVAELRSAKEAAASRSEFFYKDAEVVKVFGGATDAATGEFFPAWLNPSMVPSDIRDRTAADNILYQVYTGDEPEPGKFEVSWDPSGCREGDYFVCWSWRPNLSGEALAAHLYFSIGGGVGLTASIPTHRTDPAKYEMLMDRYTPDMFKSYVSEGDLSPLVIKGLNDSVAAGFTMIENLANQIIDLLDSNATHEQLLPLLSNMFALRLRSGDPTLWRRQIKKAIPNFKRKGTIVGLREAYGDSGMRLLKLTRLWQVVSPYTFQEHFRYDGSTNTFPLSKPMLLPAGSDFGLWFRSADGTWEDVTEQADSLAEFDGQGVTWVGEISEGDSFRVLYNFREVPEARRAAEDYARSLPLMDMRDERDQDYPPKNWNTRVVEEDDPMFGVLIPVRHPIADPVIWGWVRTEFPYSENAYNMDEYNGSKRESLDPCHIDKDFVDPCGGCQSSMFNVDLEVEGLSDASFGEALQVAEEFMPFHSLVHTFNLSGSRTEFFGPLEERIETFVTVSGGETLVAGEAQHIFNRDVATLDIGRFRRDILSSFEAVEPPGGGSWTGTLRNSRVCLYPSTTASEADLNDPSFRGLSQGFGARNIDTTNPDSDPFESGNLLEVLGASVRNYTISDFGASSAEIYGEVDPAVVGPLFEYRISNRVADYTVDLEQYTRVIFSDEDADFHILGVVSQKDVDDGFHDGDAWSLRFEDRVYRILNLLPDGTLLLEETGPASFGEGWDLLDGSSVVKSSSGGSKTEQALGLVSVVSAGGASVRETVRVGDYVCMGWPSDPSYHRVKSFRSGGDRFFIEGYDGGGRAGEQVKVYRRVVEGRVGQIGYEGLELEADEDMESLLPVSDGPSMDPESVDSSRLKDNYLLFIDSEYYSIVGVDGPSLSLGGRLGSYTKAGTGVEFAVYRFSKERLHIRERTVPSVPSFDFDSLDRSGKALISVGGGEASAGMLSQALNSSRAGQPMDLAGQEESIEFEIEYREGDE
jgi:hypothetical protein